MNRLLCIGIILFIIMVAFDSCGELTDQTAISNIYLNDQELFQEAVETGDFSKVEQLKGIKRVYAYDGEVTFLCGSSGLAVSGSSYGIKYTEVDFFSEEAPEGWTYTVNGNEVRKVYERRNRVLKYVSLGNGFWYFEDHN